MQTGDLLTIGYLFLSLLSLISKSRASSSSSRMSLVLIAGLSALAYAVHGALEHFGVPLFDQASSWTDGSE